MKTMLLAGLLFPLLLQAETKFVVYQINGNVSFTQNHVTTSLKIGHVFTDANAVINISYNSSAILICNNYSLIHLSAPNNYLLQKLNDSCRAPVNSVTSVYFRFVWDELTQGHSSIEENRRKYMHNVGAVTRGCEGLSFFTNYDTLNYVSGFFPLKWANISHAPEKLVFYKDISDETPLLSLTVENDSINLSVIKDSLHLPGNYYWNIKIANEEVCPRKYIEVWEEKKFESFRDSIRNVIPAEISEAEKMYMLAFLLEYNYFYGESYAYYKIAYDKDPSNKKYQDSFQQFVKTYFTR